MGSNSVPTAHGKPDDCLDPALTSAQQQVIGFGVYVEREQECLLDNDLRRPPEEATPTIIIVGYGKPGLE